MTRTNLIRFLCSAGRQGAGVLAFLALLVSAGCASPQVTEPNEPTQSSEAESGVDHTQHSVSASANESQILPSPVPKIVDVAPPAKAKKKKKRVRREPIKESPSENEETSDEVTEAGAAAGEILVKCVVRLPDDETDHPELCRDFRVLVLDEKGAEVTRFRFDGDGFRKLQVEPGKKYRLKPLIGSNWSFVVEPGRSLKEGEEASVVFTQKL